MTNALGDAMQAGISNYSALQTSRQMDALIDKTRTEAKLNDALTLKAAADTSSALATARDVEASYAQKVAGVFSRYFGVGSDEFRKSVFGKPIVDLPWGHYFSSAKDAILSKLVDLPWGHYFSSAKDAISSKFAISSKLNDLISNVNVSSAKKASSSTPPSHSQIYHGSARPPGGGEYLLHSALS